MMYGVMQEILLEEINTMLVLLTSIASLLGFIYLNINLRSSLSSKNFRNLLRDTLIRKLCQSKVTGEGSMRNSTLSSVA